MARGNITEYQQGSFSPSAVGTPGVNKSGQIIGQGIESLGAALVKRQETSDNLTAMDKFGEFQLQHAQKKLDLQKQYRDNPEEYVKVAGEMSQKLASDFTNQMPGGAAKRFKSLTSSAIAQDMEGNVAWAFKRDTEMQIGKIDSSNQNLVFKAALVNSPQELKDLFDKRDPVTGDYTADSFMGVNKLSGKFLNPDENNAKTLKAWETAKKIAMSARIFAQPRATLADLVGDPQKGSAYKGILDPDEINTWRERAENAVKNRAEFELNQSLHLANVKVLDLQDGLDNGTRDITDVIFEREAAEANKGKRNELGDLIVSPEYIRSLDNLIAREEQSTKRVLDSETKRKETLKKFSDDWDAYLQTKIDANELATPADAEKQLTMIADLGKLKNEGKISDLDYANKMAVIRTKTKLRDNQPARVQTLEQTIANAGINRVPVIGWRYQGNDVVSLGYQMIKDHVDKVYTGSTDEERMNLKAEMLAQYHQRVANTPPEAFRAQRTENDRRNFARNLILGSTNAKGERVNGILHVNSSYKDPIKGEMYRPGDVAPVGGAKDILKVFSGLTPETGDPIWTLAPGMEGKVITVNGQKLKVVGMKANGSLIVDDGKPQ